MVMMGWPRIATESKCARPRRRRPGVLHAGDWPGSVEEGEAHVAMGSVGGGKEEKIGYVVDR